MKFSLRWLVQAAALLGGIYFFKQLFDASKLLIVQYLTGTLLECAVFFFLFFCCFFLLLFTSYLKERGTHTLKNPIRSLEVLVGWLGLETYRERNAPREVGRDRRPIAGRPPADRPQSDSQP